MNCIINRSSELTSENVEELFSLFLRNMGQFAKKNKFFESIKTEFYKEKWINDILNEERLLSFRFYDNEILAGYILIIIKENENFVHEFQIDESYQGDGKTFKEMILVTVSNIPNQNDYTGNIWFVNEKSRNVFKHLGAKFIDDQYKIEREILNKWIKK